MVRHYFNRSGNPITSGKARGLTSLLPGTPPAIQKEMPKITPSPLSEVGFSDGNIWRLKGLCHEIDFKTFDKNLQNLA